MKTHVLVSIKVVAEYLNVTENYSRFIDYFKLYDKWKADLDSAFIDV